MNLSSRFPFLPSRTRYLGLIYLWLAVLIFGAASAITRKVTQIGSHHLIDGHNPISFCNVLFVGNLCALAVLVFLYGWQWNLDTLRQIPRRQWQGLIAVAVLSGALAPGLFFQALALTPVNNVLLVGRMEPPLTLVLSFWLLCERFNLWEGLGALTAFVGVVLTVYLQPAATMMPVAGLRLDAGALLAALGAAAAALATIIGKKCLNNVPLGVFSITRTGLGTIIFCIIALIVFGPNHFSEAFSPFLWEWMLLYGLIIVVCGETFWLRGTRRLPISQISVVSSFTPAIGILAAYLILGEVPIFAQYIGGGVILLGIMIGLLGSRWKKKDNNLPTTKQLEEIENQSGFRGI